MPENTITITQATYQQEILESKLPVLLDVWAAWCNPCRMLAPVLEQLASEKAGKLKVAKLNSDENMELAMQLNVMSLPTLLLFKNGQEVARLIGFMPKQAILARIESFL